MYECGGRGCVPQMVRDFYRNFPDTKNNDMGPYNYIRIIHKLRHGMTCPFFEQNLPHTPFRHARGVHPDLIPSA